MVGQEIVKWEMVGRFSFCSNLDERITREGEGRIIYADA